MQFSNFVRTVSGTTILLKNTDPIENVESIKYFTDNASGSFIKKEVRWSFTNTYWSAWEPLTQRALSSIDTHHLRYTFLEIRYVLTAAGSGNVTTFVVNYTPSATVYPITAPTVEIQVNDTSAKLIHDVIQKYVITSITDASTLNGYPGSYYLDRQHHTGTQGINTITNLQAILAHLTSASGVSYEYVDGSLYTRDIYLNYLDVNKSDVNHNHDTRYLKEASIGTGFIWIGGMLDVSGGGDVTKEYVDGSLATKLDKYEDDLGNISIGTGALSQAWALSSSNNIAIGPGALRWIDDASGNIALGFEAGAMAQDGQNNNATAGIYIGNNTKAQTGFAYGGSNEIVIGDNAIGMGSNTVTLGSSATTDTFLQGTLHIDDVSMINIITDPSLSQSKFKWVGGILEPSIAGNLTFSDFLTETSGNVRLGGDSSVGANLSYKYDEEFHFRFANSNTYDSYTYAQTIVVDSSDKIYFGGHFSAYQGELAGNLIKLNPDGTIDRTFDVSSGFAHPQHPSWLDIYNIIKYSDKLYVSGTFSSYQGQPAYNFIRLNLDGTKDSSFDASTRLLETNPTYSYVSNAVIDSSDRIYVAGNFAGGLDRLNSDGSRDLTFDVSTGFTYTTSPNIFFVSIKKDVSEMLYAYGRFSVYQGESANCLLRLNPDGTRDWTFDISSGFINSDFMGNHVIVYDIAIDSSGRIYCAGRFTEYRGESVLNLIRLNPDGTRDITFDISTFAEPFYGPYMSSLLLDESDNALYASGAFVYYGDVSTGCIIKFNLDGTRDVSFNSPFVFDTNTWDPQADIYSLALSNDKQYLYVGGSIFDQPDTSNNTLVRLDPITGNYTYTHYSTDISIDKYGLSYGGDYSALNANNNRWIPDKAYTDKKLKGSGLEKQWNIAVWYDPCTLTGSDYFRYEPTYHTLVIGNEADPCTFQFNTIVAKETTLKQSIFYGEGSVNNYFELNVKNLADGILASSDIVATANDGTETTGFINMGINGKNYDSGWVGNARDAYLYSDANNLLIGNDVQGPGHDIVFFTNGGNAYGNERFRITWDGSFFFNQPDSNKYLVEINGDVNLQSGKYYRIDGIPLYTNSQIDSSFALISSVNSSFGAYLKNTTDTFTGNLTINGSISLFGNFFQDGCTYETHAEHVFTSDDFITMRDGASVALANGSISGIRIVKPNGVNNLILGAGNDAVMRVGWDSSSLVALAAREDAPINGWYAYWDDASVMFKTKNVLNVVDASYVRKSGDTMTGYLTINASLFVDGGTLYVDSSFHRVGIGNNAPATKLHIGSSASDNNLRLQGATGYFQMYTVTGLVEQNIRPVGNATGSLKFTHDAVADRWSIGIKPSPDANLYFTSGGYPGQAGTIDRLIMSGSTGNIGIGTVPVYMLDVSGNFHSKGSATIDGSVMLNNQKISGVLTPVSSSDAVNKYYADTKFDASITNVQNNQTLKYTATYAKWVNTPDIWTVNSSVVSLYDPTTSLELGSIELQENGGELTFTDMQVSSASVGSIQSYSMKIDGSAALSIKGVSASTALSEYAVVMQANYFSLGDPFTDGSWRFRVLAGGGLAMEKRTSGSWVEAGQLY